MGRRQWNRRAWRRLTRAPGAVAGRSLARPLPLGGLGLGLELGLGLGLGCRAAQCRQERPEEAQEANQPGPCRGGVWACCSAWRL